MLWKIMTIVLLGAFLSPATSEAMTMPLNHSIEKVIDLAETIESAEENLHYVKSETWRGIEFGVGTTIAGVTITSAIAFIWYWGGADALCLSGLFPPACACLGPQC